MPTRDSNLTVRSITETFLADTIISVDLGGTPIHGMALYLRLGTGVQGSVPTVTVDIHASTTSAAASTDVIIASRSGMTAGAEYVIPFSTRKRAVAFAFRIGGGSTPGFSSVLADIVLQVGHDWTRTIEAY